MRPFRTVRIPLRLGLVYDVHIGVAPVPNKQSKQSKEFGRSLYDLLVWLGENPRRWINAIPWLLVVGFLSLLFAGYVTVQIKGLSPLANVGSPWVHWTVDTFAVDLQRCDAASLEALRGANAKEISVPIRASGEVSRTGVIGNLTAWVICVEQQQGSLAVVGVSGASFEGSRNLVDQLAASFNRHTK